MVDKIEILDTITDVIKGFSSLDSRFDELQDLLKAIDLQLSDTQWIGNTHDKCILIHQAIKLYFQELISLNDELCSCVVKLQKDKEDFCSQSDNVNLIQSI